jgi:hypothetical protein
VSSLYGSCYMISFRVSAIIYCIRMEYEMEQRQEMIECSFCKLQLPEFLFPKIEPLNGGLRYPPLASTPLSFDMMKVMMRATANAITATFAIIITKSQRGDHEKWSRDRLNSSQDVDDGDSGDSSTRGDVA